MKKQLFILLIALFTLSGCAKQQRLDSNSNAPISSIVPSENRKEEPVSTISKEENKELLATQINAEEMKEEIITIKAYDGYQFEGKLRLPSKEIPDKLVVFVNGSGPNTYDNHRIIGEKEFDYFDLFAEQFTNNNTAFFSYNTRGVTTSDTPPMYADINEKEYKKYLPSNEIKDVESIIQLLKQDERLKDTKVILLGWSAGTIIAPLVAKENRVQVDALLLAGYCNGTMDEILKWQQEGGSSMIFYCQYFDYNKDGIISKKEFKKDKYKLKEQLGNPSFKELDKNKNGIIEEGDFKILLQQNKENIFRAIEEQDDKWLKENYSVLLTSGWFLDYRKMPANRKTLPKLDLPIYIFQGTLDRNTPVEGAKAIEKTFEKKGKKNLEVHIFDNHDHDLNYMEYIYNGKIPEGIKAIFDVAASL